MRVLPLQTSDGWLLLYNLDLIYLFLNEWNTSPEEIVCLFNLLNLPSAAYIDQSSSILFY